MSGNSLTVRRIYWTLAVAVMVFLLAPGATVVQGQDELMSTIGIPPFTTALPIENGFVDLSTGKLFLEFPFGSWPQRGGREFKVTLVYDSEAVPSYDNYVNLSNFIGGGWRVQVSPSAGENFELLDYQTYYCDWPNEDQAYQMDQRTAVFADAIGTSHVFDVEVSNYYPSACSSGAPFAIVQPGGYATDGSGYHLTLGTSGSYMTATILAPDGSNGVLDTNGNYFSSESNYSMDWGGNPVDSLNRTVVTRSTSGNYIYFDVLDSRGSRRQFTVTKGTVSVSSWPYTHPVVTSIQLPDGAGTYSFSYSGVQLASMTLPTGATVSYSYGQSPASFTHTTSDGSWTYTDSGSVRTVTKPNGDNTVYTFAKINGGDSDWLTQVDYYSGSVSSSNLLASVAQTYTFAAGNVRKASETTTLPVPGSPSTIKKTVHYCWDTDLYLRDTRMIQIKEWKFYTGSDPAYNCASSAADRTTDITYLGGSNYLAKNIIDRRTVVTVSGGGQTISKTINCYDNDTSNGCSGSSPTSITGITHHDDTNYGASNTIRGNLTQVHRLVSGTSTYLTKSMTYDTTGQMLTETDWNGNTTEYSYSDTDKFFDDNGNSSNPPNSHSLSVTTNAYPKTISKGGLTTTYGYYWGTGQTALVKDPNNQTTYFHFYDPWNRPTLTKLPNNGWTYSEYPSATQVDTGIGITSTSFTTSCTGSSGDCRSDRTVLDNQGRAIATKLRSDPDGETTVDTTYDSIGRTSTASNPHRNTSSSTDGATAFRYDGLNRQVAIVQPDGRIVLKAYGAAVSGLGGTTQQGSASTYGLGYPVLSMDEAGKPRQSWFDGFGRLIEVDEPAASSSAATYGSGTATLSGTEQSSPNGGTSGTGYVVISGSIGGGNIWDDCLYVWDEECVGGNYWEVDSGYLDVGVNGVYKGVEFWSTQDTNETLAAALRSAINADSNYPVTASGSGGNIYLTAKQVGSSTNYSLSVYRSSSWGNSFTGTYASGSTLTGGQTYFVYDTGTAWVTVNGTQISTTYGQNSTASSVANSLASAINANTSSPVSASVSGAVVTLTATTTGANYSVSSGSSTNYPTVFSSPSFSISSANLSGGANTGGFSSPLVTLYTYDLNNNLTGVTQGSQTRTFTYDKMSRLLTAANPESGTTTYHYTTSGGSLCSGDPSLVCRRVRPAPNQSGSSTVTTTYAYDALNRLTGTDYSDSTSDITYSYDQTGTSSNGLTFAYGKTRRTGMSDGSGATFWAYDVVGNIVEEKRTIGSVTKSITYTYNKDSSLASVTYPNGRTVTYTTKGAQRQTKAEDTTNNITYATTAQYAAHGALSSLANGASNQVFSTLYYNKRLQPCRIAVNSSGTAPDSCGDTNGTHVGNVMDIQYDFGLGVSNNGNVLGITNKITSTRSQTFTYDALNRIATAAASTYSQSSTHCWGESFSIDAYGNLTSIGNLSSSYNGCTNTENFSVTVSSSTNRISTSGYCYDSAGNLLGQSNCTTYEYNAENQLVATAGVTYTYDGDGKRVKGDQTSGSTYDRLYWHNLGLDPLAESDLSGNLTEEYVFFGGKRVARRNVSSGNIFYYFADHLGTSRTIVQAGQTSPCYDADFYPYGGERVVTNTCTQKYKFTGKERDGESNLDYLIARHHSNWMGRFMQPDEFPGGIVDPFTGKAVTQGGPLPYADISDPQTINKYAYVRNNPLRWTDPDGHCGPLCTGGLGALIGGVANVGGAYMRARREGRDFTQAEFKGAFVKGAILGFVVGATAGLGAGALLTAGAGAEANVVGGVVDRAITGKEALDGGKIVQDAMTGGLVGLTGFASQGVPLIEKAVPLGITALANAANDFGESEAEIIRREKQEREMQEEELKRRCGEDNQRCG